MLKRNVSVAVAAALALSLAACGSSPASSAASSEAVSSEAVSSEAASSEATAAPAAGEFDGDQDITVISREDGSGTRGAFIELTGVEARLAEANKALSDAKTVIAGKDAAIGNLQKDLDSVTARLQVYEQKEADAKASAIENFLQKAVDEGKIEADAVPGWKEMTATNFQLVQDTIGSIPAREKISEQIATDPDNAKAAADALKSAGQKIAEQVEAVVGKDFQFKKLQ